MNWLEVPYLCEYWSVWCNPSLAAVFTDNTHKYVWTEGLPFTLHSAPILGMEFNASIGKKFAPQILNEILKFAY